MSFAAPEYSDGTLEKLVELQWQREMIERWVNCSRITPEALEQIQQLLSRVDDEVQETKASRYMD